MKLSFIAILIGWASCTISAEVTNRVDGELLFRRLHDPSQGLSALCDPAQFGDWISGPPYFTNWHVVGPFHYNPSLPLGQQQYPPEKGQLDLGASYVGSGGRNVRWKEAGADPTGLVDLREHFDTADQMMAYALARFDALAERTLELLVYSDDGVELWWNGQKIHSNPKLRSLMDDPDRITVPAKAGRNELLLKVANNTGVWAFKLERLKGEYDPRLHAAVLAAVVDAAEEKGFVPAGEQQALASLLRSQSSDVQAEALDLVRLWKVQEARPAVESIIGNPDTPQEIRLRATETLLGLGGNANLPFFRRLISDGSNSGVQIAGVVGLASHDLEQAARDAAKLLSSDLGSVAPDPLFTVFFESDRGSDQLADAIRGQAIPATVAKKGLRLLEDSGNDCFELAEVLKKAVTKEDS